MLNRTNRRKGRFQVETLEMRDVPSRLIGMLAVHLERPTFDRPVPAVQAAPPAVFMSQGPVAPHGFGTHIIAILHAK